MHEESPLKPFVRQARIGLIALIGFGFLTNMLMLVMPLYMIQVFDRVLNSGSFETLLFLTIIAVLALMVMGVLESVRKRVQDRMAAWLDRTLSPVLLNSSMSGRLAGMPASAQSLRDFGVIRQFISGPLRPLTDILWVPLFIIAVTLLHPLLGLFAVSFGVILLGVAWLNEILTQQSFLKASQENIKNLHLTDLATRNADVIHAMGMFSHFQEGWTRRNRDVLEFRRAAEDSSGVLYGLSRFLRMGAQVGILGFGAFLVLQNQLTPGGMIAGSILLARALGPLEQAIPSWRGFVSARGAYARIDTVLTAVSKSVLQRDLPPPIGKLECEKVTYIPQGNPKPALQAVSFAIEGGDQVGILGPSSAGKTTLCKILVGTLKPTDGHARLDGVDVFSWDSEELGPNVGYLPQDVELFSTSVKENIARLDPDADPENVQEAARLAGVHDMILHLPDGYDTVIGEGHMQLSGGQCQRIGLARALYGRPKLLVLDEPNSNLDGDGEEALIRAIGRAKIWGATVVLVTHQVRLLRAVNKVLVLREGRSALFGDRDDVLEQMRPKKVPVLAAEQGEERAAAHKVRFGSTVKPS
jgi:PrtD family type I secretion system ABC transporter